MSHLKWWRGCRFLRNGAAPFPLTVPLIRRAAAALKFGGDRSAYQYLCTMRKQHIKMCFSWTPAMDLEIREAKISCRRGIGPSKKAGALPLERVHTLPKEWDHPLIKGGPARPRATILVGSWRGMRDRVGISEAAAYDV